MLDDKKDIQSVKSVLLSELKTRVLPTLKGNNKGMYFNGCFQDLFFQAVFSASSNTKCL